MTITVRDVVWEAGGRRIVDGASLTVAPGRMLGLLGPNGSGKSSLLRLICGLRRVTSGVISFDGVDVARIGRAAAARQTAFVEQHATTDTRLSVLDVVRLGRTPHRGALSPWTQRDEQAVADALCQAGLSGHRDQAWHTLSGGERQRAQIARALAQCPQYLLLDEPTNHLDIRHQLDILSLVSRLPVTAIVALHDINLAAMFCDTVAMLQNGRVVASGLPEEVLTEARIADIYGVQAHIGTSPHHGKLHIQYAAG